jgi:FAIM1 (Fas apoptotic inhibitory molecule) protein
MAEVIWHVTGKDGTHTVRLEHALALGTATVAVDGEIVYHRRRKLVDSGLKQRFTVDGVECLVRVIPNPWLTFWRWLWVDGKKQEPVSVDLGYEDKIPLAIIAIFTLVADFDCVMVLRSMFWGVGRWAAFGAWVRYSWFHRDFPVVTALVVADAAVSHFQRHRLSATGRVLAFIPWGLGAALLTLSWVARLYLQQ